MRVQDRNLGGTPAPRAGQSAEPDRAHYGGPSEASRVGGGTDQVELSHLAGRLSRAIRATATERAGRVERLAKEVQAGHYAVDSAKVARALVKEAVPSLK